MSARGVKPTPLLLEGLVILKPPKWLTKAQKQSWRDAFASAPTGLLSATDAGLLAVWVVARDLHRQAAEEAQKFALIVKSPEKGVPMQNPYLAIINRQAEIMLRAAAELGFTPIARTRMARTDPDRVAELTDEPQGKKAQAQVAAVTADEGTGWEGLLRPQPSLMQ